MSRRAPSTPPQSGAPDERTAAPVERPPVEELSDVSWARVERRLWAELDRAPSAPVRPVVERRRWPWLAAATLAAAAVIAVIGLTAWPSSEKRTIGSSMSRVATASAPTEVSFGDAAITVAPSSAVIMQGHVDRGVSIVLERGSATFSVAPREGRPPFMVVAGAVQVRVIGTRFTVTRSGDDARVDVAHGEVEVVAWGRREVLLAGASWSSDGVREAAVGGSAPVANPDDVAAAHFSPPSTEALAGRDDATAQSVAPVRSTPRPPAAVMPSPPTPPAVETPAPAADAPRARFDAATALERSDPALALERYRELARGDDRWAANALYAAADLALRMGNRELAVRYARAYQVRFPQGTNAQDAERLLARVTGASP